jgi:amino acid transporter
MDIQTLTTFFMWCTIINLGLLILTSLVCIFLADFSYRMNNRFFSISRDAFNIGLFSFIGLFKIFVIVFNLVPYIALLIIG